MLPRDCSLIIPASGVSKRFGTSDKLLANLAGRPLADYAAGTASKIGFKEMIAVIKSKQSELADIFRSRGFEILHNANPELGHRHSIQLGVKSISSQSKAVCIMLADMPLVPVSHIQALLKDMPRNGILKTSINDHTQPPAVFAGRAMQMWNDDVYPPNRSLKFPEGRLPLAWPFGEDVDTQDDLKRIAELTPK